MKDDYDTMTWGVGDTIKIINLDATSENLRVMREDRTYAPDTGEDVTVQLANYLMSPEKVVIDVMEGVRKWGHVDQSISARSSAE